MDKKILIIEDDVILREVLSDFLVKEGFTVVTASNGEEGVNQAKKKKPDLIILDIILPKKDGFEVIKDLKRDEKTEKISIVLLTNLESLNDIEKALNLGATTYLIKSDYSLEEVVKKIKDILNR